jgi:hypothetical protein
MSAASMPATTTMATMIMTILVVRPDPGIGELYR